MTFVLAIKIAPWGHASLLRFGDPAKLRAILAKIQVVSRRRSNQDRNTVFLNPEELELSLAWVE